MERILPQALRRGDEVAVVSPASGVRDEEALERGLERLRALGLSPVLMPHARGRLDWPEGSTLAAPDAARLADLETALADPRFRAVFAARGGYGVTRLLGSLDLAPLAADPKPIVGYSDVTALLAATFGATGVVGFHGPMVATTTPMDAGQEGWALQAALLMRADEVPRLPAAPGTTGIAPGFAEGPLVGGNLTLVQALIGTRHQLDLRGAILFPPYRVDRMLTHLRATGALACAAGIVLGDFHVEDTPLGIEQPSLTAVLEERLADLPIPVARGFPIGHLPGAWTVPFGGLARLSVPAVGAPAVLELLEPAVRDRPR